MKYTVEINNKTKDKFSKKKIEAIFERTICLIADKNLNAKKLELSVALVSANEICLLNRQYRRKNSATDVLSFAEYEKTKQLFSDNLSNYDEAIFIGELIICPSYVKKNALEDGETFEFAMTYIVSHGILHLLGFSHGKKMFSLQRAVADELVGLMKK